jgi:hypothetical protein
MRRRFGTLGRVVDAAVCHLAASAYLIWKSLHIVCSAVNLIGRLCIKDWAFFVAFTGAA